MKLPKHKQMAQWLTIFLTLAFILSSCNLPQSVPTDAVPASPITEEAIDMPNVSTQDSETAIPVTTESQEQVDEQPTNQVFLPQVEVADATPQTEQEPEQTAEATEVPADTKAVLQGPPTELAYLYQGDLYLVSVPSGSPTRLTTTSDILNFAWAPGGNKIATYTGQSLCFVFRDGSQALECIDLGLTAEQALIERQISWSPEENSIVLWNSVNPQDENAIGWLIINLDGSNDILRTEDPVDWGLALAPNNDPGGITGQALYLMDGTLVGTMTHRWLCGSGGCHYQLFQFDISERRFSAFANNPDEGFSEGQNLVLSQDGKLLVNFGTFMFSCEDYFTFIDIYNLETQTRNIFNLKQEAISDLTLSPDSAFAVVARTSACNKPDQTSWASVCGLTPGYDVYPMQIWEFANDQRTDVVSGISPAWSSNGSWLAFNSCLVNDPNGNWVSSESSIPEIFVRSFLDGAIIKIGEGINPAWRPWQPSNP